MSRRRFGILGGSFNPPHIGHLICAQQALCQLELDEVILMPVGVAPHKRLDDPGAVLRLELCECAIAGNAQLSVSRLELDRPGPSYTVATLRELHAIHPEDELTFIVGGDMAQSLPSWREPAELLRLARLAVAERAGAARDDIAGRLAELHDGQRVLFFDMPRIDVSSSAIRRRVAEGRSIRYLVPEGVADRIAETGLYGASSGALAR